jgi:hypothetical protein
MRVRVDELFPGEVFPARLAEPVNPLLQMLGRLVLALDVRGVEVQVEPPGTGVELVEATAEERASLRAAGFATGPDQPAS